MNALPKEIEKALRLYEGAVACEASARGRDEGSGRRRKDLIAAILADREKALKRLTTAVSAVYYAAHWTPDREVDAAALWTELRDAAGFTPSNAPCLNGGSDGRQHKGREAGPDDAP